MSINDSIGNSTIGSTAPAEGTAEPGVSQGVGIDQEQPAKGSSAFATRASKSSSEGLSKGKLLLPRWWACGRGSLLHHYGNCRPCAQETDCGKATGTATETSRNEAGQRQRHACYGHCAYRRAGQFGRPAWPRRHPEDTRIDGSERRPNRVQTQRRSLLRQSHEPGARWRACRRSSRHNRSGKILRLTAKRQTSQPRRTSSKTH